MENNIYIIGSNPELLKQYEENEKSNMKKWADENVVTIERKDGTVWHMTKNTREELNSIKIFDNEPTDAKG